MCPQMASLKSCIIALDAFVWFLSTVHIQMLPQIACLRRGMITLDFAPLCIFKYVFKTSAREETKLHWLHLFDFSPLCILKCCLTSPAWEEAWSHWIFLRCVFSYVWIVESLLHLYHDWTLFCCKTMKLNSVLSRNVKILHFLSRKWLKVRWELTPHFILPCHGILLLFIIILRQMPGWKRWSS